MNLKSVLKKNDIYPLFGELLKGDPYVFDFSSKNPKTLAFNSSTGIDVTDTSFYPSRTCLLIEIF